MQQLKYGLYPLEATLGWKSDVPFQEKVSIEGKNIFLCGIQATHSNYGEVVGSAASLGGFPLDLAWFELLERISIIESMHNEEFQIKSPMAGNVIGIASRQEIFPQSTSTSENAQSQYSKSNGVALHSTWHEACLRSCLELVERHLVLSSWVGRTPPRIIKKDFPGSQLKGLGKVFDIIRIEFGQQRVSCFSKLIHVSGIALLPKNESLPLVIGFGAGFTFKKSMIKAEAETLQRLGFLWGEDIPLKEPEFCPSHLYHQEYFLVPSNRSKIERWLAGDYATPTSESLSNIEVLKVSFIDLNPLGTHEFHVAKALSPDAIPLVFGKWREREFKFLPEERLIHPIA